VMLAASLRSRRLDGFIAVHYPLPQAAIDELHRQEAPLVMLSPQATPNCAAVHINDFNGGRAVGRHLLDLGHRHIAFLGAPGVYSNNRRLGLREVLADAGVEPYELISNMPINKQAEPWLEGQSLTEELFASNTDVTAVVCSDDFKAVGALTAARRAGLTIPDDLSIVGYDNFYWTAFADTPLTTVHQPKEDQGACAVELLQELRNGMPPREVWLEPELIVRGSTARARE